MSRVTHSEPGLPMIEQHRDVMALGRNVSIKNRKPSRLGL